jgi:PAS domain S-box-containing protein
MDNNNINEKLQNTNKELNNSKDTDKENESKYQFIVENTEDILWTMDGNLQLDYVSPSVFKFMGYTVEEHLNQSLRDYLSPESAKMIEMEFGIGMMHLQKKEYDKLRNYAEFEVTIIKKDKTDCLASIKLNVLRDSKYNITKIRGVTIDRTKHRLAEKALEEKHNLLFNLAAQVPGVIYQYRLYPDGSSCFPYSSPGMFNIYEVTPDEVREDATPVFGRLHPNDLDRISESIFESAKTQKPYTSEFRVVLPEQGLRWRLCHAQPQLLEDGSTLWHGIISDITDRVLAEKAIKKSEQKFNNIIKNLPGYVYRAVDFPEHELKYLSSGFETITGYSIDEALGKKGINYFNYINSEDLKKGWEITKKAIELKESFEVEYRITTKDGKTKWLWEKGRGIYDNNGKYSYTEGYTSDITDRRKAEESLKLSEEKYRLVANNSADVIFILNLEMKYTFISPSITALRGYMPEDIIGQPVNLAITPESLKNIMAAVKEEFEIEQTGTSELNRSRVFELEMYHKNGTTIWTETKATILRDEELKMIGFLGITRDITERKHTQEIIKKSNETYHIISEKITDVVWLMNLQGKSTYVSPSIERFTGFTAKEYLEQTIPTRFTKESAEIGGRIFYTELNKYKDNPNELTNYTKQLELEYLCKDGTTKWGELIITPYFNENNMLSGIHGVTRDITERKKIENEIKEKSIELERFNKLMVGREVKMIDLKKEVNELLIKLGLPTKYKNNE